MSDEQSRRTPAPVTVDLDRALGQAPFRDCDSITVVVGAPISDIGKGHLAARLAAVAPGSSTVIKVDGILNTNVRGNHPAHDDDLATYRQFLPDVVMGWPNQILGGDVLREFLDQYGGTDWEHLSFVPHLAKFFVVHLHRAWVEAGSPRHLVIELGGTIFDRELTTFVAPGLTMLREMRDVVQFVLLTTLEGSLEVPKTRGLQEHIARSASMGIHYSFVAVRSLRLGSASAINKCAREIDARLAERMTYPVAPPVLLVPLFSEPGLVGYTEFLRAGVVPLLWRECHAGHFERTR